MLLLPSTDRGAGDTGHEAQKDVPQRAPIRNAGGGDISGRPPTNWPFPTYRGQPIKVAKAPTRKQRLTQLEDATW